MTKLRSIKQYLLLSIMLFSLSTSAKTRHNKRSNIFSKFFANAGRYELKSFNQTDELYVLYKTNFFAPLGFEIGDLGRIGWYMSYETNISAFIKTDYDFNGTKLVNYNRDDYYGFDNSSLKSYWSLSAGANFGITEQILGYAGMGFGNTRLVWKGNTYDYITDSKKDNIYIRNKDESDSGILLELGGKLYYKKWLFNLGTSTIGFKRFYTEFGFGYVIN